MAALVTRSQEIRTPSFWVNMYGNHPDRFTVLYDGNVVPTREEATTGLWAFVEPEHASEAAIFIRETSSFEYPFILVM